MNDKIGKALGASRVVSIHDVPELLNRIKGLEKEVKEQCRLNGIGAEREAALISKNKRLLSVLRELKKVSKDWMQGQNTMIRTGLLVVDEIVDKALRELGE